MKNFLFQVRAQGWLLFAAMAAGIALPNPAQGFDCSKAGSPAEKRICADPSLARMDQEMAALYRNVLQASNDGNAWKADQRAWLARRDQCRDDTGCLRSEYQTRLMILRSAQPPAEWAGHWWRIDPTGTNGSELAITKVTPKAFDFDLNASGGANTGELSGKAVVQNYGTARFDGSADSGTEGCSLAFKRVLNRLKVEQTGDDATCGAGAGVYFGGVYLAAEKDPNPPPDLISLGVLPSKALDDALRKLIGKDYDAMVATANTIDAETETVGGNAVTTVSMAVRGVACNTKSILIFDDKGHLWAAIWEPVSDSSNVVELRYYTSVSKDKHALPRTISENQEACSGDIVRVRTMP